LLEQAKQPIKKVLTNFGSSLNGLNDKQYRINKEKYGSNVLGPKKQIRWYRALFDSIINPFSIILIIISILNIIPLNGTIDNTNWVSFSIIIGLLIITSSIKMFQELRSSHAAEHLREMVKTTTAVERNNLKKELPVEDLVPGDIVHLAAGDIIPADILIISAKDLFISQSALTGESEPVEKHSVLLPNKMYKSALEASNLCFMGTSVSSGTARGAVLSIGANTFFGQIAKSISKRRPKTNFDKGIKSVS
jgi:Mg2+-importing ATPase